MGKCSPADDIQTIVLGKRHEFPERRQGFSFPEKRNTEIQEKGKKIRRNDSEKTFDIKCF